MNLEKEKMFIDKLKRMTSYAKKIGIGKVFVSIMVGLPGESIQDAQKTIDLVDKLESSGIYLLRLIELMGSHSRPNIFQHTCRLSTGDTVLRAKV